MRRVVREPESPRLVVTLHDVEPATFERCALIRDWLADNGVARVTLLVVPATDLHPLADRSSELVDWLIERRAAGDAIAQHGFTGGDPLAPGRRRPRGEFAALGDAETRRAVDAGWRVLRLAGIEPRGFVAPAYELTPALQAALPRRFAWWAGAERLYRAGGPACGEPLVPALQAAALGVRGAPWRTGTRGVDARAQLRLDVRPHDLERGRRVAAVERLLLAARTRHAITLDDLAGVGAAVRAAA